MPQLLSPTVSTSQEVVIDGEEIHLVKNGVVLCMIPFDSYEIWIFEGQNPLNLYNGQIQYPCQMQFKGDKNDEGKRKSFMARGEDWFGMFSLFSKVNSEKLFRYLAEKQDISQKQIQQWIDTVEDESLAVDTSDDELVI